MNKDLFKNHENKKMRNILFEMIFFMMMIMTPVSNTIPFIMAQILECMNVMQMLLLS